MNENMDQPFLDNRNTTPEYLNYTLDTSNDDSLNSSNQSKKVNAINSSNRSTDMSENKGYAVNSSGAGFYGEIGSQEQSISIT